MVRLGSGRPYCPHTRVARPAGATSAAGAGVSVTLEAEWADGKPGEWSAVVRFTLTNGTEDPLVDPLVEFTVADKQVVERNTGITLTRTPAATQCRVAWSRG